LLKVLFNNITTSQGQGQGREAMSGGSLSAKWRAHKQECHIRLGSRDESAQDDEVHGIADQGKWWGCAAKVCVFIRGDLGWKPGKLIIVNIQLGIWKNKPRSGGPLPAAGSEPGSKRWWISGARTGNRLWSSPEVSRGHSSLGFGVMAGAGRRAEHFSRWSLCRLQVRWNLGGERRNQS
jgi:hypothetical protein